MSSRISYHRQRRQRGLAKVESHRYYLKHRTQNKLRAKKRYRRLKNNGAFKRHQTRYRQNPQRYRRLAAENLELSRIPFWSSAFGPGVVLGVDEEEVYYVLDSSPLGVRRIHHQDFLNSATFLEEGDVDLFFDLLDDSMGVSYEVRAVSDALVREMERDEVR